MNIDTSQLPRERARRAAAALGYDLATLTASKTPTRPTARALQAVMWTLRQETRLSLSQIGRLLGRDHGTVHHGIGRHQARLAAGTAPKPREAVDPLDLARRTAAAWGANLDDLIVQRRVPEGYPPCAARVPNGTPARALQAVMWTLRQETDLTTAQIGRLLGNRSVNAVLHGSGRHRKRAAAAAAGMKDAA